MSASISRTVFSALVVSGTFIPALDANATQCVWNKGGYVLKVEWFEPNSLNADLQQLSDRRDGKVYLKADDTLQLQLTRGPVQTDKFPIGQGRCIDGGDKLYTAILSVVGGDVAANTAKIATGATVPAAGAVVTGGICVATLGTACAPTAAAAVAITGAAVGAVAGGSSTAYIPNPKEVFYVGTPQKDKWLDAWGTVYNPQAGPGGDIPPGNLGWNADGAHDKGCSGATRTWHVRCEFAGGQWSTDCPDMTMGPFKGQQMLVPPKRLGDRAWSEVKVACGS